MKQRIAGLDGIRAIASLAVVFCHTVAGSTQIGGLSVNIFFVLSGFLILKILYDTRLKIDEGTSFVSIELWKFWKRRFARICPVYYVVAAVAMTLLLASNEISFLQSLAFLTYTQNFLIAATGEWTKFGYTWTLAVEQQFYLIFALLMLAIPARLHRHVLGLTSVGLLTLALVLFSMPSFVSPFVIYRMPLIGCMLASAGGWAALTSMESPAWRRLLSGPLIVAFVIASLALAVLPSNMFAARPFLLTAQLPFVLISLTAIIAYLATNQQSVAVYLLERPILKFYGNISYSLYLIHGVIANWLKDHWFTANLGIRPLNFAVERLSLFATVLSIATVLAYLSWKYIERAFLRTNDSKQAGLPTTTVNPTVTETRAV